MTFLHQGASHQLDQMNRDDGYMTATENRDTSLTFVLQQGQLLGQGVDPIKGWEIQ